VDDDPAENRNSGSVTQYLDLGLRFALAVALCAGGGYWLDTKLNTIPLFLIVGLILGATSGLVTIYRAVYPANATEKNNSE
jgi:F0F1-type ATP synthase assembly protein I